MATRKEQQAAKRLEAARAALAEAEAKAREAGIEVGSVASPAVHVEKRHSDTVFVGCKMPNGLLLRLHEKGTIDRPVFGGGVKAVDVWMPVPGEQVRLKPCTVPFGAIPNFPIIGNYSITEVKRSFWEKWLEQNKTLDLVKNGVVFALSDKASAEAKAREQEGLRSNLEPIDPAGDPRTREKSTKNDNLTEISIDDERDALKKIAQEA